MWIARCLGKRLSDGTILPRCKDFVLVQDTEEKLLERVHSWENHGLVFVVSYEEREHHER